MKLVIKVDYNNPSKYRRFCYSLLRKVKSDMIIKLDRRKIDSRKSSIDSKLSVNFDYYQLYLILIKTMYLEKEIDSDYYSINFDGSIKVKGIRAYLILKIIEYGVVGVEPYPFIRKYFYQCSKVLNLLYSNYCKEGNVDLSLRKSNNR